MAIYKKKKTVIQTVEEERSELAIKLLSLKDETIIHAIKVIVDDLTAPAKKITKAKYNREIDAAVKRVRNGKSVSHDQVMKEMDGW